MRSSRAGEVAKVAWTLGGNIASAFSAPVCYELNKHPARRREYGIVGRRVAWGREVFSGSVLGNINRPSPDIWASLIALLAVVRQCFLVLFGNGTVRRKPQQDSSAALGRSARRGRAPLEGPPLTTKVRAVFGYGWVGVQFSLDRSGRPLDHPNNNVAAAHRCLLGEDGDLRCQVLGS